MQPVLATLWTTDTDRAGDTGVTTQGSTLANQRPGAEQPTNQRSGIFMRQSQSGYTRTGSASQIRLLRRSRGNCTQGMQIDTCDTCAVIMECSTVPGIGTRPKLAWWKYISYCLPIMILSFGSLKRSEILSEESICYWWVTWSHRVLLPSWWSCVTWDKNAPVKCISVFMTRI